MPKEIKKKIEDWEGRITFNQENDRFEFDGVEVNDEEDLEYIIQTITDILSQEKQKWVEKIEGKERETDTYAISNDRWFIDGYNQAIKDIIELLKET